MDQQPQVPPENKPQPNPLIPEKSLREWKPNQDDIDRLLSPFRPRWIGNLATGEVNGNSAKS